MRERPSIYAEAIGWPLPDPLNFSQIAHARDSRGRGGRGSLAQQQMGISVRVPRMNEVPFDGLEWRGHATSPRMKRTHVCEQGAGRQDEWNGREREHSSI